MHLRLFPLGGATGTERLVPSVLALAFGLVLGWGVPGLSLVFLSRRPPNGMGLLARALGLGFAYIFATGMAYAVLFGHAPGRTSLLGLLALPCVVLSFRRVETTRGANAAMPHVALALVAMALLVTVLWPSLHGAALNGDGTEVYELARSLEANPFPHWDVEGDEPRGRFGIPVVVPFFTGAFLTSAEMTILGRGELAARMPFVFCLVIVAATAVGLAVRRGISAWTYAGAVTAVFVLWHTSLRELRTRLPGTCRRRRE